MFRNKRLSMVLSLVLALLLWGYVVGEVNPTKTQLYRAVPIEILNEAVLTEEGLALAGNVEFASDVILQGKRADFINLKSSDIRLTANLANCSLGENYVSVNISVPSNITVQTLRAQTITVSVEERKSRLMPVQLVYTGTAEIGKEASDTSVSPADIYITGAKSAVESVYAVRAELDYADIGESASLVKTGLKAVNSAGEEVPRLLFSQNDAEVYVRMLDVKTVPLEVETTGETAESHRLESVEAPNTVSVKGDAAALAEIESIRANDIDVSGLEESTEIELEFELPGGVYLANESKGLKARVNIEAVESRSFVFDSGDIEAINGEEGLVYGFESGTEIELTAYSDDEELLSALEESDFTLTADVSGAEEGEGVFDGELSAECAEKLQFVSVKANGEIKFSVSRE